MRRHVRQILVVIGLLLLAPALSGCIVEDGGGRRCGWWHHCR
jgi:hypothetical protein